MKQVARNLVDPVDGFLRGAKHLIHDRDPLFTEAFLGILGARGVESVKIPAQSPNCNPHAERFVRTIKYDWLPPAGPVRSYSSIASADRATSRSYL